MITRGYGGTNLIVTRGMGTSIAEEVVEVFKSAYNFALEIMRRTFSHGRVR